MLQSEFQKKMEAAVIAGRADQAPLLIAELQAQIQDLTKIMQSAPATEVPEVSVYGDSLTGLNLNRLAYSTDRDFFIRFKNNATLVSLLEEISEAAKGDKARRNLLANSMRLNSKISKPLFDVIQRCQDSLNFKVPLEIFVVHDHVFNAGVIPMGNDKIAIYFTSGLLESFNPEELTFVIGHEMGHALFRHTEIPVQTLVSHYGHTLSAKDVIRLRSWQRAAELSADRAGLICARDFKASCSAFFKLSSGITSAVYKFSYEDYMEQYADLEKYIKSNDSTQNDDLHSSHPLNPLRLRALEIFSQSEVFADMAKVSPLQNAKSPLTDVQLDSEVRSFMSLMEPNYLEDSNEIAGHIREFMFLAGFMLAKSDGTVHASEVAQLSQLFGDSRSSDRIAATLALPDQAVIDQILVHAGKINFEVPPQMKINIVRDLFEIICSDGVIDDVEIREMGKVCNVLMINPGFVDELVAKSQPPMPKAA